MHNMSNLLNTHLSIREIAVGSKRNGRLIFSFREYSFQSMASYYSNGNGDIFVHNRSIEQRNILIQKLKDTWFYTDCFESHNGFNIS